MKAIEAKVVVLGSRAVGKTSIVTKYLKNALSNEVSPTIGASFFICKINLEDVKVKLQVWDTAGQERFKAVAPMYYRNANAAFLVFDITQYRTFSDIKTWAQELHRNVQDPIVLTLIGNKLDLEASRAVSRDDANLYASSIGAHYYETSADQNRGLDQVFLNTALGLVRLANENKCHSLRQYESNVSISAYSSMTIDNSSVFHLPAVDVGIPVDENDVHANSVGRLERASWSIDHIAHGDAERSGWCC